MNQSFFGIGDMLQLSQYNNGFGTARSAAMGGAFTSLGADLSSMNLNPAGLGMYQSSEVGLSPSLTIGKTSSTSPMGAVYGSDNSKTQFGISNLSLALNLYQSSGNLTSFTLGFGYNKLADFNYRAATGLPSNNVSIADVFNNQLRGLTTGSFRDSAEPWLNHGASDWGAILAYKTQLVDPVNDGDDNVLYIPHGIAPEAQISHYAKTHSRGSIGEYSIAGGFNINNVLYLGLGMGVQDIYLKQTTTYEEIYDNNITDDPLDYMIYDQTVKTSGTAVNFKFGATVRPIDGLRIGIAVHTPSIVSIQRDYSAYMFTRFMNGGTGDLYSGISVPKYDFVTPTRLMAGISYTFGQIGILSFDYERAWYNGMRLSNTEDYTKDDYKTEIKDQFKGANTFRAGGEFRITPQFSLRAGYAYMDTPLQDNTRVYDMPFGYKTYNISGGLGYRFNSTISLDLSYVYMNTTYTMYDLYYYDGYFNDGNPVDPAIMMGGIDRKLDRHNVTLSLGIHF